MDESVKIADKPKQRSWQRLARKAGIVLFLLSFLMPPHWNFADDFYLGGGFAAFIQTPVWALISATNGIQGANWRPCLCSFLMVVGWSANFTVFFRLSLPMALIAIASPWVLYTGMTFLGSTVGVCPLAIEFIPFYPWSFGIALIHLSKLAEPKPEEERRTVWTGF
jgi:hypothetical protein